MSAQLRLLQWYSSHNFYHNCNSNTYAANDSTFRNEYGSDPVSGFYSKDTVNSDEVSIAHYTFAEVPNVSGHGLLYSLGKILTKSAAWLHVLLPVPCCEQGSYSSKDLVVAGAEHVFAFYLEDHVDVKLTINGVEKRALHKVAHKNLKSTKSYGRSHCWLQNEPKSVSLTR